jgi:hypothetical protein
MGAKPVVRLCAQGSRTVVRGRIPEADVRQRQAPVQIKPRADPGLGLRGGRQLDGAPSSIVALPGIADAAGSRIEVLMNGGIRSGQDVLKAVAMGAKGVFIGRTFLYGLGAYGQAGVAKSLAIIRQDLDTTMALCGHRDIRAVDRSILQAPPRAGLRAGRPNRRVGPAVLHLLTAVSG